MPRRDGTGPLGRSSMNGRGLGFCAGTNAVCNGANSEKGSGRQNRGLRRNVATDPTVSKNQIEWLQKLESKLDAISKHLENL
ncbi:MAG: DUF5320 domain-containing protein [Desulfosporosinus sp.]|nr:DUF5320 domain-containing protein [Desulfosporosinus sp.]